MSQQPHIQKVSETAAKSFHTERVQYTTEQYIVRVFGRACVVDASSSLVRNVQKRRGEKSEENRARRQKKKRKIEIGTLIKKAEIL